MYTKAMDNAEKEGRGHNTVFPGCNHVRLYSWSFLHVTLIDKRFRQGIVVRNKTSEINSFSPYLISKAVKNLPIPLHLCDHRTIPTCWRHRTKVEVGNRFSLWGWGFSAGEHLRFWGVDNMTKNLFNINREQNKFRFNTSNRCSVVTSKVYHFST